MAAGRNINFFLMKLVSFVFFVHPSEANESTCTLQQGRIQADPDFFDRRE